MRFHLVKKVGPVEGCLEVEAAADVENVFDVCKDLGCDGGCQPEDRDFGKQLFENPQVLVVWSEVVTPL